MDREFSNNIENDLSQSKILRIQPIFVNLIKAPSNTLAANVAIVLLNKQQKSSIIFSSNANHDGHLDSLQRTTVDFDVSSQHSQHQQKQVVTCEDKNCENALNGLNTAHLSQNEFSPLETDAPFNSKNDLLTALLTCLSKR